MISLISTIKELQNEKIIWVFVGGGRSKNKFISKLDRANLKDNCLFVDPIKVSEIPEIAFYADAMFLSLKPNEVFSKTVPAKLQSYLALRKPVIGVLQGEGAEIIKSSNCGIVEEKADYLALANNIRSMLKLTKEKMREMGNSGREYYDKNFSQSTRKNQLLKLFS